MAGGRPVLLLCLVLALLCCQVSGRRRGNGRRNKLEKMKLEHKPKKLTQSKLREIAALTDIDRFMGPERLDPILKERVPGTPGNAEVRQYIVSSLQGLQSWDIEENRFSEWTPHTRANTEFVNIIATLRNANAQPESDLKLVLACHYDSKYYPGHTFVGATDSAVPCAMLLDLAHNLKASLDAKTYMPYTLQLIFFDGEEAFIRWTSTDSIYGSRHLAQRWADLPHHSVNNKKIIDGIGLFVLLDLLGAPSPKFNNFFSGNPQSDRMYKHLQNIERRLAQNNELISYSNDGPYFNGATYRGMIEDDHKPFLNRGVDVVHVIASPFPPVWHQPNDNKSNLNRNTISNLNKIFHVFVVEFLHLKPPE
ncbi:glutaminyl-peptide cyclotransferase-like isoform X2 [Patiria miniata]|uniref:Glutaminyl-peptide cyclotransferase n=1 Tax=Patiria miniata TaxID=46514 RepID=A0A914B7D2_PATMI|nr:glutaminyl-peptide cyclotransferase-like isoform X2 [Patiria miniata]XP_038072096.1 glutaminyl-peptide cyclotransferase-like isoform X2 [Patiria miniata]